MIEASTKISVMCPCFNEIRYLPAFLKSLAEQTVFNIAAYDVHVMVVDGASTDGSYEYLTEISSSNEKWTVISNPERYVSNGLNRAVAMAQANGSDYLIRMDLHALYPADYIHDLISGLTDLLERGIRVGNYGGVVRTLSGGATLKAELIAKALSSSFGVGGSLFRVGASKVQAVDTVPFGCFPIAVFEEVGGFDEDLIRNQDDEFNGRLKNAGYEIFLDPNIVVDYYARGDISKVYKMFFQYGYYKPLVNKKLKKPATLRQFAPPLFVLVLFFSIITGWLSPIPFLGLVILYSIYSLFFVLKNTKLVKANWLEKFVLSFRILFVVHFSYGWGYLLGIFGLMFRTFSATGLSSR